MLYIDLKDKNKILDENGNIRFWCQYDFAYKGRSHVYDNKDNEIGYVQFKILSIQKEIGFFDKDDNPIQIDSYEITNQKDEYNFDIKFNDSLITIKSEDEKLIIDYDNNIDLNKCILFIVSLLNKE